MNFNPRLKQYTRRHKQLTTYVIALGLTALLTFGGFYATAFAQRDTVDFLLTDIGEGEARILTSNWRTLAAGEQHTYTFEHDDSDAPITIWMNSIPTDGALFQVWTSDQLAALADDPATAPLGAGSTMAGAEGFTSWTGDAPEDGAYYVSVLPVGDAAAQYLLNISSGGLTAEQAGATEPGSTIIEATPTPTIDPTIATVTTGALNVRQGPSTNYPVITTVPNGTQLTVLGRNTLNTWINVQLLDGTEGWVTRSLTDYVNIATVVDAPLLPTATPDVNATPTATPDPDVTRLPGEDVSLEEPMAAEELGTNWRVLNVDERQWYRFQHQGGDLPVHIWMDTDPNEGAGFRVYTEENAQAIMAGSALEDIDDIGRGTRNPAEPGYLFWRGVFNEAGPFYVLVTHGWDEPVYYSIHAAGPGLSRPAPE